MVLTLWIYLKIILIKWILANFNFLEFDATTSPRLKRFEDLSTKKKKEVCFLSSLPTKEKTFFLRSWSWSTKNTLCCQGNLSLSLIFNVEFFATTWNILQQKRNKLRVIHFYKLMKPSSGCPFPGEKRFSFICQSIVKNILFAQ